MSLIPAFEIGLWNAWILTLIQFLTGYIVFFIDKEAGKRGTSAPKLTQKEKLLGLVTHLYIVVILYSIFVPLKLGTTWFYAGLIIYFLGLILSVVSYFNFATTPLNEPVVKGVYKISRHPQYFFGAIIAFLGAGIASASWLIILLVIIYGIFQHFLVLAEERFCLEKYGEAYREYMNRTPRWIGIPK